MGEKQGTTEGMSSHQPQEMMDSIARFSLAKKDDISSGELHTEHLRMVLRHLKKHTRLLRIGVVVADERR